MEIPINLYIILFANYFPFQTSVFCHSKYNHGDVLDNNVQKYEKKKKKKKKKKKMFFCPRMHIFIFTFQFSYLASSL